MVPVPRILAAAVLLALTTTARPAPSTQNTVTTFFAFRPGTRWTYRFVHTTGGATADGPDHVVHGRFTETVTAVDSAYRPGLKLVTIHRIGDADPGGPCPEDPLAAPPGPRDFYYLVATDRIFSACSKPAADTLAEALRIAPAGGTPDTYTALAYVFPLASGAAWGADPGDPKRDDGMYEWSVDGPAAVHVPAGRFPGCYWIDYRTMPDLESRALCPGIGVASIEYSHHGTLDDYTIELEILQDQRATARPH